MGWDLSEDVVAVVVDRVVDAVVGFVLTTTVDGLVGSCIGVVLTISWYSTASLYWRALVVLTMSWYSTLSWYCSFADLVVLTMSWYSNLPLSILSVVVVTMVDVEVGVVPILLALPVLDLAGGEGREDASGCVEFTGIDGNGRRIFRFRIRSRFDGL